MVHRALQHLGPDDYAAHAVVSQLADFPGVGWPLISRVASSRWRGYRLERCVPGPLGHRCRFRATSSARLEELLGQECDAEVAPQIRALLAKDV